MKYIKKYQNKTEYQIYFQNEFETKLVLNGEQSPKVIKWLSEGNQFEVIPFVPMPLAEYKVQEIESMNQLSFTTRNVFLPDYKLINAGLDVYEDDIPGTKIKYKNTVKAFRTEFYRLQSLINEAVDHDSVDAIVSSANYPTDIIG